MRVLIFVFVFALLLAAPAARAGEGQVSLIGHTTTSWSELVRLLSKEGASPKSIRAAPREWAVPSAIVEGDIEDGRARLHMTMEVEVLADRWILLPLLPPSLALSSSSVTAPEGRRGLLAREPGGIGFVADGAGHYRIDLQMEGPLESGRNLRFTPPRLVSGRARLRIRGAEQIGGRSDWRREVGPDGTVTATTTLGAAGLDLTLSAPDSGVEQGGLDDFEAITVLSLGGAGVTRVSFDATPDESGELSIALPRGARPWKIWIGGAALPTTNLAAGDTLHLPLRRRARIEIAYTFTAPPLGLRGRYHVELPRPPLPVRGARWELWLPAGLAYAVPQSSLAQSACNQLHAPARTPLAPAGQCHGFAAAVLEPRHAFIEGTYDQPF